MSDICNHAIDTIILLIGLFQISMFSKVRFYHGNQNMPTHFTMHRIMSLVRFPFLTLKYISSLEISRYGQHGQNVLT